MLEDDGAGSREAKTEAKMEARKEEQPKGAENHSAKSVTHLLQLSPSTHSDVLKYEVQPEGNLCQCSFWEVDQNRIQSSKQSEKTVKECEKCQLCLLSPEVSLNQAKKRQCHMMSSPDESDQSPWRRGWRPQETSVWRSIGLSPDQSRCAVLGCQARPDLTVPVPHGERKQSAEPQQRLSNSSESPSPVLRPSSALSGTLDNFCNPMSAVGQWPGSTFSPSLSAFSLTGLSLEEVSSCSSSFQPQRCHSQPSVLPERRGFKKRRRDEKRPNLNFIKMKETAYARRHQSYNRARNIVHLLENTSSLQLKELECSNQSRLFYSLDTIASSPQELIFSPASVSLSGECLASKSGSQVDSDDQSTYRESLDSGCSGDSALHLESESLNDLHTRCKQLKEGIEEEEEEEVFEINVLDDLDIDEIEKD